MKELADVALDAARRRGASYADVRLSRNTTEVVSTRERRVENVASADSNGFGVRVLVDGAWGFAASNKVDKAEIERVAARAVEIAAPTAPFNGDASRSCQPSDTQTPAGPRLSNEIPSPSLFRRKWTIC